MEYAQKLPKVIKPKTLVIFDDYFLREEHLKDMVELAIRLVHHGDLNLIVIAQRLYQNSQLWRTLLDNLTAFAVFKLHRGWFSLSRLASDIFPPKLKPYFMEAFQQAVRKPHGYLLIDLSENAVPGENLYSNVCDEDRIGGMIKWRI